MKRTMLWYGPLLALVLLAISGCSDDEQTRKPDIYWVGMSEIGKPYQAATVWKNGAPNYVTDGTIEAMVYDFTFSGNSVYVLGKTNFENSYATVYWKDGEVHQISSDISSYGNSIGVDGNDVYVAGEKYDYDVDAWVPRFWKNGELEPLPDPTAKVNSIVVSNGIVYASGYQRNESNSNYVAMYWKDGVAFPLSDGTTDEFGLDLAVAGNGDVYVIGYSYDEFGKTVAKYWKNDDSVLPIEIDIEGSQCYPNSITVSKSGDVYVAGAYWVAPDNHSTAAYWKNGELVTLENDGVKSHALHIAFDGTDVYTAGNTMDAGNSTTATLIWKNGEIFKTYPSSTYIASLTSH